jgi:hypothetical protein
MAVTINPSDEKDKGPSASFTIGGGTNRALWVPGDPQSPYIWKDGKWQPSNPRASEEKHGN